ncbi:hypothetical protein CRENBAI_000322 [Crenichthys baileyi]|uniref:Uncharacterized protein n=1 Tax=Crenichthys baileyi TaxID=28760 RepID=A0AAV9SJX9_9TELE
MWQQDAVEMLSFSRTERIPEVASAKELTCILTQKEPAAHQDLPNQRGTNKTSNDLDQNQPAPSLPLITRQTKTHYPSSQDTAGVGTS